MKPFLAIGLMSGTSADGIDAAAIRTDGERVIEFLHALTLPYEQSVRSQLLHAAQHEIRLSDLLRLERCFTELSAAAVSACVDAAQLSASSIDVIGFHGHTIRHQPALGVTMQLGDGQRLAELTQCRVVHDFRRRDMAVGGEGAPLAPLYHQALLPGNDCQLVLNLGGVANITWMNGDGALIAGDTGPGCGLLDLWAERHLGQRLDEHGSLAASGFVHVPTLESALQHPYFARPLPKSADRFEFNSLLPDELAAADGAATLCALTAEAVARSVRELPAMPLTTWVSGGGMHNLVLMRELAQRLPNVRPIHEAGVRSDSLEAECFAWLAVRRLRDLPTSLPGTTGCSRLTCGGSVTA